MSLLLPFLKMEKCVFPFFFFNFPKFLWTAYICFLSPQNTLRQINAQLILKTFSFIFIAKTDVFSLLEARSEVFESMVEYLTDDFCPHVSLVWI